jgi:NADPH:quinone reductase-like Zn-dependent oxidoreductase
MPVCSHTDHPCSKGSYQQYVVSPARYTTPIPDGVDDFTAGPIMCSASTIHRSLVEANLNHGDWAVFPGGGGGVGLQGVQLAKAMGLRPIVVDAGAAKRDLCMSRGAEAFIDFNDTMNVTEEVIKVADGVGAHGVFVTAPAAYKTAVSLVGSRVGAKVMCIALRKLQSSNTHCRPADRRSSIRWYNNNRYFSTSCGCPRHVFQLLTSVPRHGSMLFRRSKSHHLWYARGFDEGYRSRSRIRKTRRDTAISVFL